MLFQLEFERVKIIGDGHCLFRCMSMVLWGHQDFHSEIRKTLVHHVVSNWEEYCHFVISTHGDSFNSPHKYVSFMGDEKKRTYGTEFEISIFCQVYQRNIRLFRKHVPQRITPGQDTIF